MEDRRALAANADADLPDASLARAPLAPPPRPRHPLAVAAVVVVAAVAVATTTSAASTRRRRRRRRRRRNSAGAAEPRYLHLRG
jgi:hypothetical protein